MHEQLTYYIKNQINLSEDDLKIVLSYFKPLKLKKNELLVTHGQTSQHTYFVGKGCLRIFFINEEGQEATRYFAFENQFATALVSSSQANLRKNRYRRPNTRNYFTSRTTISTTCSISFRNGKDFTVTTWKRPT